LIFVDTSFWVALLNRRDARQSESRALFESRADSGLVTSNHVRGETWTFLRRRAGHAVAVEFLDALQESPRIQIVTVETPQEEEAFRWLRRHDEREYSFVDARSFVLMRALRLREALAFDGDFSAAGFVELRES